MSGHRNFKEFVAKMSPERRERINPEADELNCKYVLIADRDYNLQMPQSV